MTGIDEMLATISAAANMMTNHRRYFPYPILAIMSRIVETSNAFPKLSVFIMFTIPMTITKEIANAMITPTVANTPIPNNSMCGKMIGGIH